jgi:hypothetical protein
MVMRAAAFPASAAFFVFPPPDTELSLFPQAAKATAKTTTETATVNFFCIRQP